MKITKDQVNHALKKAIKAACSSTDPICDHPDCSKGLTRSVDLSLEVFIEDDPRQLGSIIFWFCCKDHLKEAKKLWGLS